MSSSPNNNGQPDYANVRSSTSQSSGSGSSGSHGDIESGPSSRQYIPPSTPSSLSGGVALYGSPSHRNSFMGVSSNTVGLDTTSQAIARGEVGANYSRYSTGNLAALAGGMGAANSGLPSSVSRMSMMSAPRNNSDETPIEMDALSPQLGSPAALPAGRSRFSEYGLDGSSSESPSLRDSTLYDNRRESLGGYYGNNKSMEDTSLLWNEKNIEADDFLHDPRTLQTAKSDRWWNFPTSARGILNAVGICILLGGFLALFMGWPIHTYVTGIAHGTGFGWNMGGVNASGQVPDIPNLPSLIDSDTPDDVKNTIRKGINGRDYQLVFSDEFNVDGRTFYAGDDPYWEAVDIHYWQTRDLEWYDPDAVTTKDGHLLITLSEQPINGLNFRSGMIQSWNKLCFNKGAYIEVSMSLPGNTRASGYWPGAWTMGNLGRAGFGASNDGMWPYSYDTCDVGTLPGQALNASYPPGAFDAGVRDYNGKISILAGQRASACTCRGQPHPGPNNKVGRGAPEIDILEAQVDWRGYGTASQSIQIAPFDYRWIWDNTSSTGMEIYNSSATTLNQWKGAATQESASAVTIIGTEPYGGEVFTTYGYEYVSGGGPDSQITWTLGGNPTWTLKAGAFPPDDRTMVGQRLISEEPMYMILNLAISSSFQALQFDRLEFPGTLHVDYVRVWQEKGQTDITCDPASHPTADYINQYMEYYTNPNITTWPEELWPKNSLVDNCA